MRARDKRVHADPPMPVVYSIQRDSSAVGAQGCQYLARAVIYGGIGESAKMKHGGLPAYRETPMRFLRQSVSNYRQ